METRSFACFQIGDAHLILDSSDAPLTERFQRLYGDCEVDRDRARGPRVTCTVRSEGDAIAVEVHDDEPVDLGLFMETAFGDRGCRRLSPADAGPDAEAAIADGWQIMRSVEPPVTFAYRDRRTRFPADSPWRALAANLATATVLRVQRETIFFHASGVALGQQRRGVLFMGPKGAGKTTTALGLASRGHGFLGDEIIGVRRGPSGRAAHELIPVLRTIGKRDGPCAQAIDDALATVDVVDRTRYPDGQTRTVIAASSLFALNTAPAPLAAIVFLDGFGPEPQLTPLSASFGVVSKLTPITSTLWGQTNTARAFTLMKLLTSAPSYLLRPGPPDATSPLLEHAFAG